MGWIRERILSEKKKHEERLDWAQLAEDKILAQIRETINSIEIISKHESELNTFRDGILLVIGAVNPKFVNSERGEE